MMEKNMETTIVSILYRVYMGMMENAMEASPKLWMPAAVTEVMLKH